LPLASPGSAWTLEVDPVVADVVRGSLTDRVALDVLVVLGERAVGAKPVTFDVLVVLGKRAVGAKPVTFDVLVVLGKRAVRTKSMTLDVLVVLGKRGVRTQPVSFDVLLTRFLGSLVAVLTHDCCLSGEPVGSC
jgi:hypothetical protein